MDLLTGLSLFHQFFLLGLGQFGEHFVDGEVIGDGVVADGQPNLLLFFLEFALVVVASFLGARAGVRAVVSFLSSVLGLAVEVMIALSPSVLVGVRAGAGTTASHLAPRIRWIVPSTRAVFFPLSLISHLLQCSNYNTNHVNTHYRLLTTRKMISEDM